MCLRGGVLNSLGVLCLAELARCSTSIFKDRDGTDGIPARNGPLLPPHVGGVGAYCFILRHYRIGDVTHG